jgi:hypothetical protein
VNIEARMTWKERQGSFDVLSSNFPSEQIKVAKTLEYFVLQPEFKLSAFHIQARMSQRNT